MLLKKSRNISLHETHPCMISTTTRLTNTKLLIHISQFLWKASLLPNQVYTELTDSLNSQKSKGSFELNQLQQDKNFQSSLTCARTKKFSTSSFFFKNHYLHKKLLFRNFCFIPRTIFKCMAKHYSAKKARSTRLKMSVYFQNHSEKVGFQHKAIEFCTSRM